MKGERDQCIPLHQTRGILALEDLNQFGDFGGSRWSKGNDLSGSKWGLIAVVERAHSVIMTLVIQQFLKWLRMPLQDVIWLQLHTEEYYSVHEEHNPLITKIKDHLSDQWCPADHRLWLIEMWKTVIWSDGSSFTVFSIKGRVHIWCKENGTRLYIKWEGSSGSIMLWETFFGTIWVPLEEKVIANQCNFQNWREWSLLEWQSPCSQGTRGHWIVLWL